MKLKITTMMSAISAPCCRSRSLRWGKRACHCLKRRTLAADPASVFVSGFGETVVIEVPFHTYRLCQLALYPGVASSCFALMLEEDRQDDEDTDDDAGNIIWHIERHDRLTEELDEDGANHRAHNRCMAAFQWSATDSNGCDGIKLFAHAKRDRICRRIESDKRYPGNPPKKATNR